MRTLVWDNSFKRAFQRIVRKNPQLEPKIFAILQLLETDPFAQPLKSHKLRGQLEGLWACSVEYDCRLIYAFKEVEGEEFIILINIGTHDEVY